MIRTGAFLALAAVATAAAVISGANALPHPANDDADFAGARAAFEASLDRAAVRLDAMAAAVPVHPDSGAPSIRAEIDQLAERRLAIVRALDSVAAGPDDDWRGAMPGLRASVTDLEAKIDRTQILATDSVPDIDALLGRWLSDAERSLTALDDFAERVPGFATHADEIDSLRETRNAIAERFGEIAGVDDDRELRDGLGEEIIAVRRRLRALERATSSYEPALP